MGWRRQYPDSDEYKALSDGNFADYRLRISGLVANLVELDPRATTSATAPRADHPALLHPRLVRRSEMGRSLDADDRRASSRGEVGHLLLPRGGADKGVYYDAHPIEHMSRHLTMLAYNMNDAPLPFGDGAPLRLRNEIELGFKQVKWIKGIEFVARYSEIGGGYGGYNQDHEFFGYRQSI